MLFNFRLRQLDQNHPWDDSKPDDINWFKLTDGWYWMSVESSELFRYTDDVLATWQDESRKQIEAPYVNYYVVRLWEDLLEILPHVLEPISANIAKKIPNGDEVISWHNKIADYLWTKDNGNRSETYWDTLIKTTTWMEKRWLPTNHLKHNPQIWFWSDGKNVFIDWDNRNLLKDNMQVWTASYGVYSVPVEQFIEEVRRFDQNFMNAMQLHIDTISNEWRHPELQSVVSNLREEQAERSTWLEKAFTSANLLEPPPWDDVESLLEKISKENIQD